MLFSSENVYIATILIELGIGKTKRSESSYYFVWGE